VGGSVAATAEDDAEVLALRIRSLVKARTSISEDVLLGMKLSKTNGMLFGMEYVIGP